MPKMFVHAPAGFLSGDARAGIAAELTDLGMSCERLADRPQIRDGVWTLFTEHAPDTVFVGGRVAVRPIVAIVVYAIAGGLDEGARTRMIAGASEIVTRHASSEADPTPVFVVIQETPEVDWGMFGKQVALADLRTD